MVVILNEVKNLLFSTESTIEILRLPPQNDITTQPLKGGWGDLAILGLKWIGFSGLVVLLFFLPLSLQAQEDAARYLEALGGKYSGLKDYTVDVNIHFDIETFKAPDLKARLYYKVPDKMKVESKRVLLFPKEGGYFNPSLFKKEDFTVLFIENVTAGGKKGGQTETHSKKDEEEYSGFCFNH